MKRVLLAYATREGQTRKVAQTMAEHMRASGAQVSVVNAAQAGDLSQLDLGEFDQFVFGASMHMGAVEPELIEFLQQYHSVIQNLPHDLFVVLLSAATKNPQLRAQQLQDAQQKVRAQLPLPFARIEMIAGAITYSRYSWPKRWLMRRIARQAGEETDPSQDYEYTDWNQVRRYARSLVDSGI